MTYYADLGTITMVDYGSHIRAIGWLDNQHEYKSGRCPPNFVRKLRSLTQNADSSNCALGWPLYLGFHACEICNGFTSDRNLGVPYGDILFVAPEMVSHYVEEHSYLPPQDFIDAVMHCAIPGTKDYYDSVVRFGRVQFTESEIQERYRLAASIACKMGGDESAIREATRGSLPYVDDEIYRRVASLVAEL